MCGIAGILGPSNDDALDVVRMMLNAMVHRGPDQHGLWRSSTPGAVLGHRRLSIIDLSEAGRQPMQDTASGVVLSYNGECYNYLELKSQLQKAGYRFRSSSDTEVLLNAYLEWGINFVDRVRGMFAIAIWDPNIGESLLIRDRLGIKPLYYTVCNGSVLFASEVRSLLATGSVPRHIDPNAVASYLWQGFVPGPDTIVKDLKRLAPGTLMRIRADGSVIEQREYWRLPGAPTTLRREDAVEVCQAELARSATEHLAADVPLGVFLSGGVDSSAMAALAQRGSAQSITTYNIRFDEPDYDESVYARQVSDVLGTDHRELTLTEAMFSDQLDDALGALDQPTFDGINTYFVSRAVKDAGLTVALAGTGGYELFGGYSSFKDLPKARSFTRAFGVLPSFARNIAGKAGLTLVSRGAGEVRPQVRWGKLRDLLDTRGDMLGLYQVSYALFSQDFFSALLQAPGAEREWGLDPVSAASHRSALRNDNGVLEQISRLELANFLGERLLPDTDTASMAVSLEVRVPLLDHQFIESLAQLSSAERYAPIGRKQFLRTAISGQIDPAVFDRPKAGFELPLEKWCRNRLAGDLDATFRDINLAHSIGLDAESVARLWRAFTAGAPGLYWSRLWGIFVLMTWCKRHKMTLA